MLLSKKEVIERYLDGKISYIETIGVIAPMWIHLYPNHRISPDGTRWVRVGVNKKFNPDGKLRWELKYSNTGDIVK